MSDTYVALLRGINVGGKNKMPMQALIGICSEAGCTNVQTYIQSGNVIFQAPPEIAEALPLKIATLITERFGYRIPVLLRTAIQLAEIVRSNPFLEQNFSKEALHVMFLRDLPSAEKAASLDPSRSSPNAFAVRGSEIYLHLPNGVKDTKLTNAYFDTKLATISTSRNWKTVATLLGLMGG
jgi:uncharacterized protein (DUF1697 family)